MRLYSKLAVGVGVLALVVAIIAGFAPIASLSPELDRGLTQLEETVPGQQVALLVGAIIGIVTLLAFRRGTGTADRPPALVETPPETAGQTSQIAGRTVDTAVSTAATRQRGPHTTTQDSDPQRAMRTTVVAILCQDGVEESVARTQVANGRWTNDPIAGAFLGEDIVVPLWFRVLRWLRPDLAYQRSVHRTATAIQTLRADRLSETHTPPTPPNHDAQVSMET